MDPLVAGDQAKQIKTESVTDKGLGVRTPEYKSQIFPYCLSPGDARVAGESCIRRGRSSTGAGGSKGGRKKAR